MSDAKFEEFLQREAKAYNTPPAAAPRDEMWQVIAAARATRRDGAASPATPAGEAVVTPLASRKPRLRYAPWIGMAATLLIGVGIGRYAMQRDAVAPKASTTAVVAAAASTSAADAAPASDTGIDPAPTATDALDTPADAAGAAPDAAPRRTLPTQRTNPTRVVAATDVRGNTFVANGTNGTGLGEPGTAPEQVASREHLQRAEALISVVAATPADAMMDSLTGRWAREMLTNTRLLLDSPAGDDPARRRLLEDLETLLVQIVQRSGGAVDERFLIDRTLERTQLLTRLRTGAAGI